jgi:hypothetical protein
MSSSVAADELFGGGRPMKNVTELNFSRTYCGCAT